MSTYGSYTHLMQVFDFDAADLTANRVGRLSAAQKERIKKGTRRSEKDCGTLIYVLVTIRRTDDG
jgi:hypothetical protein